MKRIGFLTSGGDCQSLNATMRGVAKTLYENCPDVEIYGVLEGYKGLIYGNYRKMEPHRVSHLRKCALRMKMAWTKWRR